MFCVNSTLTFLWGIFLTLRCGWLQSMCNNFMVRFKLICFWLNVNFQFSFVLNNFFFLALLEFLNIEISWACISILVPVVGLRTQFVNLSLSLFLFSVARLHTTLKFPRYLSRKKILVMQLNFEICTMH